MSLGVIGAVPAGRVLSAYLIHVTPLDAPAIFGAAAVLVSTAVLAAYIPARKAANADPLAILRSE